MTSSRSALMVTFVLLSSGCASTMEQRLNYADNAADTSMQIVGAMVETMCQAPVMVCRIDGLELNECPAYISCDETRGELVSAVTGLKKAVMNARLIVAAGGDPEEVMGEIAQLSFKIRSMLK